MSVLERQSRFIIKVIVGTIFMYLVVGGCTHFHPAALSVFGLYGLLGFTQLIGRSERLAGKVIYDERDLAIGRKATVIGYSVFWTVFVVVLMLPLFYYGPDGQITIHPAICAAVMINAAVSIIFLTRSFAVLALYRWGNGNV